MTSQGNWLQKGFPLFLGIAALAFAAGLGAEAVLPPVELKEAARGILQREQESVVSITGKVRLRRRSDGSAVPGHETTVETLGTVLDRTGLTVVSNSALDPGRVMKAQEVDGELASPEFSFIEIILSGGGAVPASIVYRDRELDLAFLKPDARIAAARRAVFRPVNLDGARDLKVMDDVVMVARLEAGLGHAPSVRIGSVASVLKGSRSFYSTTTELAIGAPSYAADGALVGIAVHRMVEGEPSLPMILASETVGVIADIAEATGFLAARSQETDSSLTEGLTLSFPASARASAVAASAPPAPPAAPAPAAPAPVAPAPVAAVTPGATEELVELVVAKASPPVPPAAEPPVAEPRPEPVPARASPKPIPAPPTESRRAGDGETLVAVAPMPGDPVARPKVSGQGEKRGVVRGLLHRLNPFKRRGGGEAESPADSEAAEVAPAGEGGEGSRSLEPAPEAAPPPREKARVDALF